LLSVATSRHTVHYCCKINLCVLVECLVSWYCRKLCYFTVTIVSAYMVCSDDTTSIVRKYQHAMCTLAYCSKVEFCTSPPQGCAILTVSNKCEVHLLLKVCAVGVLVLATTLTLCWKYQAHTEYYSCFELWSLEFMSQPAAQTFCLKCPPYTIYTWHSLCTHPAAYNQTVQVQAANLEI